MSLETFYKNADELISAVNTFARKYSLVEFAIADHICFKCDSKESFEHMRAMLEPESCFVYQSYISRRRIAVIKLEKPFETDFGKISVLELSDQKPDNSQSNRFDHIEIYPRGLSYEEFVAKIEDHGAIVEKVDRPHHTTHDIQLSNGYQLKLTREPLLDKIRRDEML